MNEMKDIRIFILSCLVVWTHGCSTESLKRAGYDTLQNIEDERCLRDLSSDCPERESYDEYQRKTQDLKTSQ